jgi:hypothetical protein
VRLKNGGLVRGTIVELVPNDSVTIQLGDGRTRKFPIADTTFAGSAAKDPEGSPPDEEHKPYAIIHAERAHLSLVSDEGIVTFHLQTGTTGLVDTPSVKAEGYDRLCTAPCSVDVPAGAHRFALSNPSGDVVATDNDVIVKGSETLRGHVVYRHGMRVGGILLASLGPALGVGAIVLGVGLSSNAQSEAPTPLILGGTAVAVVSLIAGLIMATRFDYSVVHVEPSAAAVAPSLGAIAKKETPGVPNEVGAAFRF